MRVVALISQPMRASHCVAYLSHRPGPHSVLTSDPTAFDSLQVPEGTRLHKASPPPELLPRKRLARSLWLEKVLKRARAGSWLGRWLEGTAKRIVPRLRQVAGSLTRRHESDPRPLTDIQIRDSSLYRQLMVEHSESPVDQIVAFDVFDLPVGMAFADDYQIPIVVR